MRETRFFYGKKAMLLVILGWLLLLNESVLLQMYDNAEKTEEHGEQNMPDSLPEQKEQKEPEEAPAKTPAKTEPDSTFSKDIRVLLMNTGYRSYYHPEVTVTFDGKTEAFSTESPQLQNQSVKIEPEQGKFEIPSIQRQEGTPAYEGSLEIRKTESGLVLVNTLPVETYLKAVVPSEMPSSYHEEALKAQAVCARTYAWKQIREERLKEYGADVDDSVNFQVYGNLMPRESTTKAVLETEGQVLCQNGELIEAYYFSTSAGATSTDEVWGAEKPASYLKSVECSFDSGEPWSKWSVDIPWENLENRARLYGMEGKSLTGLEIIRKNESGAVTGLRVVQEDSSFELSDEYAVREFLSPDGCAVTERDGTVTQGGSLLPSAYFSMEVYPEEKIALSGGGYGHGVGMSQNAANQMAKQGYSCEEILKYFFQDIEIIQGYCEPGESSSARQEE